MPDRDADSFVIRWPDGDGSGPAGRGAEPDAEWSDPDFDVWGRGPAASSRSAAPSHRRRRRRTRPLVAATRIADDAEQAEPDEAAETGSRPDAPEVDDTAAPIAGRSGPPGVRLRLVSDPTRPRS